MEAFTKVGDQDFPKRNVDGGSNYQKGHSNHNSQLLKSKYLKRKENVIYSSQRRRKILFLSKVAKSLKSVNFLFVWRSCIFWHCNTKWGTGFLLIYQKYEPSVLLLKDRHGYFELSPESENMLISILLWITEVKKWYDLDFLTRSSGTSSWTVGSSSMMSSMLSLFPPSWLTMYFQYIYFFPLLFDDFVFGGLFPQVQNTFLSAALLFT